MNKNSVGYLIKHYRLLKGITIKDFTKKMGVSRMTVYNWESNKKLPSLDRYTKIAKVLGIDVAEFTKYFK